MVMIVQRTSVVKGAILTVSMRWIDRLIGIISTLILARLLAPTDFGIIAMGSLVIGLLNVLLDLGVQVALIQNPNAEQSHYDTAWTLRLIQCVLAALFVFAGANLAGEYFNDLRVSPVMQVLSASLVLAGLENIGVVEFQKKMQFGRDFQFVLLKRLAAFITTVTIAWFFHSYWALVVGTLVGRAFGVLLSYEMHTMRPRLSMARFSEIFAVSQWMLARNVGSYLDANLHKMLVGRRSGAAIMGGYSLADEISSMPTGELLLPLNRVLFPVFVEAKDEPNELKRLYLLALGVQTLIGIPASVGLALVANEAIGLMLGPKWTMAVPFIQLLVMSKAFTAISTSGNHVLLTLGKTRNVAIIDWLQVAVFCTGAFVLLPAANAIDLASLRVVTVVSGLSVGLWFVLSAMRHVSSWDIVKTVARPVLGASAMSLAVMLVAGNTGLSLFPSLALKISIGVVSYPIAVLILWVIVGRPEGAESYLLKIMNSLKRRKKAS